MPTNDNFIKDRLDALRTLRAGSLRMTTRAYNESRDAKIKTIRSLASGGLASEHLSSIGEIDEKVTLSITDAGRKLIDACDDTPAPVLS